MILDVRSRTGAVMPGLGLGTWRMGESAATRREEVEALRTGLDRGLRLIDTAEMYGDGGAEEVVAEAIRGRRDDVFLVSKVLPHNASRDGTIRACEASLSRLRSDWLDLYLLHWPGSQPIEATFEAFDRLALEGKIRHWGVSNFDVGEMERAAATEHGGRIAVDQVLFNLERRGIERNLLPWCRERGIVVMAYSPLEQARLRFRPGLRRVADRHDRTPMQIALAWLLTREATVAIPKASRPCHVVENAEAAEIVLTKEDLDDLDRDYPVPERDVPLDVL